MDDSKKPSPSSQVPPPFDPFPTYQTPYPRSPSSQDEDNPFIQFRRFADQQFSSIFNSLGFDFPSLFGHSSWPSQKEWDEMSKRRQQMEEGWKKQWEQQAEEMRAEQENLKSQIAKDFAATGLSEFSSRPVAPVQVTELDVYEAQAQPKQEKKWGRRAGSRCTRDRGDNCQRKGQDQQQQEQRPDKKNSDWFALGYDGRQKAKSQNEGNSDREALIPRTRAYSTRSSRRLDPVDNPDHTLPWLLISPYSPLYLCNPTQDRLVGAFFANQPSGPMNVFNPWFREPRPTHVEEQLAKTLPWADAFEDLLSFHHTGEMPERNFSTWRTPDDWIAGMVGRGVLKGWQLDDEGRMIRNWEASRNNRRSRGTRQCGRYRDNIDVQQEELEATKAAAGATSVSGDEWWPPAAAVNDAMKRVDETQVEPKSLTESQTTKQEMQEKQDSTSTEGSSFWNSSSWSTWDNSEKAEPGSVISTTTSTQRRTLPDGRIETRKVLSRRFADGREESRESVEHETASKPSIGSASPNAGRSMLESISWPDVGSKPTMEPAPVQDKKTLTQTQPQKQIEETRRKGGWFWN